MRYRKPEKYPDRLSFRVPATVDLYALLTRLGIPCQRNGLGTVCTDQPLTREQIQTLRAELVRLNLDRPR